MIHPHVKLVYINDIVGYGVFATQLIPKGTITYVKDILEIDITQEQFENHTGEMQRLIEKYSYIDPHGNRVISWDFGKYVNHCCNSNTMSTGYGFEIAIRDIQPGEQITDEYGIFNLPEDMEVVCEKPGCRNVIRNADFDHLYPMWDDKIKPALEQLFSVEQPLLPFLDDPTSKEIKEFFVDQTNYKSVYNLKIKPEVVVKSRVS
jgi:uncharacterized protein